MGAYLSNPITDKYSETTQNQYLSVGASSMQGWRCYQEDAHNVILNLEALLEDASSANTPSNKTVASSSSSPSTKTTATTTKTAKSSSTAIASSPPPSSSSSSSEKTTSSTRAEANKQDGGGAPPIAMFGVYDGHGGAEVAKLIAQSLPRTVMQALREHEGDFEAALEAAFLQFDATLLEERTQTRLTRIMEEAMREDCGPTSIKAKRPLSFGSADGDAADGEGGEGDDADGEDEGEEVPPNQLMQEAAIPLDTLVRQYLQQQQEDDDGGEGEDAENGDDDATTTTTTTTQKKKMTQDELKRSLKNPADLLGPLVEMANRRLKAAAIKKRRKEKEEAATPGASTSSSSNKQDEKNNENDGGDDEDDDEDDDEEDPDYVEGDEIAQETEEEEDEEESEEDEETLQKRKKRSKTSKLNKKENEEMSSEDDEENDHDNDEEEEESDEDDEDDEEEEGEGVGISAADCEGKPGVSSGSTAVVALLAPKLGRLFVANAGDSRCVLSRGGRAVDLSHDHKPEDEPERERIEAAGGSINAEGRVNGGLNLSRALGDHFYKTRDDLPPHRQMISPRPDLITQRLQPDDEFLVLACDGIWNSMTSQQVVDFVRERLGIGGGGGGGTNDDATEATAETTETEAAKAPLELDKICEEMFDECLAPDTNGDGVGLDNMTCVIVRFRDVPGLLRLADENADATADSTAANQQQNGHHNSQSQDDEEAPITQEADKNELKRKLNGSNNSEDQSEQQNETKRSRQSSVESDQSTCNQSD